MHTTKIGTEISDDFGRVEDLPIGTYFLKDGEVCRRHDENRYSDEDGLLYSIDEDDQYSRVLRGGEIRVEDD